MNATSMKTHNIKTLRFVEKQSDKFWIVNERYEIGVEGICGDMVKGGDLPSYIFELRDILCQVKTIEI